MPAQPAYFHRLDEIFTALRAMTSTHLDRLAVEKLRYCESFNGKLRDECLNGEIFYSLKEAQIVIELWREEYNTRRPHSALDYRPPAPGACNPFLLPEPISQPQAVM